LIQDHEKEGMKCKDGTVSKSILYSNFNYKARPLNVERSLCCDRLGQVSGEVDVKALVDSEVVTE